MTNKTVYALIAVVKGLVIVSAIASTTLLALLGAPTGFTICSGLAALLCIVLY